MVLFVLVAAVLLAWSSLRRTSMEDVHHQVQTVAEQSALRLQEYLNSRLLSVQVVQQGMASGFLKDQDEFTTQALAVQEMFGGFQALNWIDEDFRIRWVVPESSNEGAIGRIVLDSPLAMTPAAKAVRTGRPKMSIPLNLFQGGRGFTTYFPVFDESSSPPTFTGLVNAVFQLSPLVEAAFDEGLRSRYRIEIRDYASIIYRSWANPIEEHAFTADIMSEDSIQGIADLDLLDRTWILSLRPHASAIPQLGADQHRSFLIGGLAFSLAASIGTWLFLMEGAARRRRLEESEVFSQQETQARKMEAIGQLAGGIAHDFNNLLTVITGNASLAAASTEPDAKSQVNLERIQKACLKASEMTGRLLAFSRTGPADHGQCDASLELLSLRDLLLPLVRENIDFSLEVGPNLGTVRLAPSELGQIVLNLMSNALDAMPGGGRLVIRASQTKSTEGGEQAAHVVLEAQDEGTGMEQEVAERMFEPFFTTKPAGKGTGLGLSTTYGIVQSAGGTIEVQSRPGEGTMIKIVLPSSNHNALPLEDQRAHMVTSDRSLRILVAEDEKPVRQVAIAALEKAGHEVVGVEDGLAALDLFEQDRDFDLVFSDMVMPKLGGLSLARRLRTLGFRGSLLLCSGYTTELSLEDLKEVQAEFLAKPYSPGSLASAVSAIAQSTMDEERGR